MGPCCPGPHHCSWLLPALNFRLHYTVLHHGGCRRPSVCTCGDWSGTPRAALCGPCLGLASFTWVERPTAWWSPGAQNRSGKHQLKCLLPTAPPLLEEFRLILVYLIAVSSSWNLATAPEYQVISSQGFGFNSELLFKGRNISF